VAVEALAVDMVTAVPVEVLEAETDGSEALVLVVVQVVRIQAILLIP
jgi:hypothetical protein